MRPRMPVKKLLAAALALGCGALAAFALLACGSQTTTVTVGSAPAPSSTATQETGASTGTTATSTTQTSQSTTSSTPSTTRTATEPEFAEREKSSSEAAATAASVVRSHGYTPNDTGQYRPNQTLAVLVGTRTGSGDGYAQQAFFFIDGKYIGTDTKEPSAMVRVVGESDTSVTLAYPLYRHSDPLCCPGGGQATVRYELNNGKLVPVGAIPPASSSSGLSRH
jgi:hypothetical protein